MSFRSKEAERSQPKEQKGIKIYTKHISASSEQRLRNEDVLGAMAGLHKKDESSVPPGFA